MNSLTSRRKSTRSENGGNCIEVGEAPGVVGIRDTKNRDGGALVVSHADFVDFLDTVKDDRLR
ncbi:hypothetical protein FHR81_005285 [Actinoalloteichus hoggarensis]|uniref:Uncharacterized protein n=1 Tax=Actinoalloteichus hoggarensis TaxID=1470176 RepID=A0A221W9F4_9PSEU|nr:DUF397 domain-containing protein [Actinoalloteichus hoggarensis]ASO22650.1 hypothetical protein AHOG_25225 [Actinoalloteichus hoggarensis]MBB5924208.1 hypothetical protein [Actinoalloteichus hoggarensis]